MHWREMTPNSLTPNYIMATTILFYVHKAHRRVRRWLSTFSSYQRLCTHHWNPEQAPQNGDLRQPLNRARNKRSESTTKYMAFNLRTCTPVLFDSVVNAAVVFILPPWRMSHDVAPCLHRFQVLNHSNALSFLYLFERSLLSWEYFCRRLSVRGGILTGKKHDVVRQIQAIYNSHFFLKASHIESQRERKGETAVSYNTGGTAWARWGLDV